LNAEEIAYILNFSRSNTSMGLKELQAWNLVKLKHLANDRRDYFCAPEDVWLIFKTLAKERKKREIDPTLSMLRESLIQELNEEGDRYAQTRMQKMHELIELTTNWFDEMEQLDEKTLRQLMQMGQAAQQFLKLKNRLPFFKQNIDEST
jgi:DNA-binding transcriptional regulator GbsR (MarR family)